MFWTVKLEGGPRRVNHAAVTIGDFIYSFGGYCTGENYAVWRPIDIHVLNTGMFFYNNSSINLINQITVSLRWKLVPVFQSYIPYDSNNNDIPYQRYGHTVVAYGHLM